jgi:hypothetical protein
MEHHSLTLSDGGRKGGRDSRDNGFPSVLP